MKKQYLYIIAVFAVIMSFLSSCKKDTMPALIVTGQNNHNWQASSPLLKQILELSGKFSCEIATTPAKGGDMSAFNPDFSKYKVVVIDYVGDSWSDKTNKAFIDYVNNGGGVVIYHASSIAFPGWKEYNEMIGLGFGGRDEKNGPYVYYKNNRLVTDTTAGKAGTHGGRREFTVRTRIADHPVMKGLPARWVHGSDELYSKMRGPAQNMQVLATAFADTVPGGGTMRDEPCLMTITYGKGRIFHTTMGHADEDGGPAMKCSGFIVTLQRGAEWAATGEVTQEIPYDFPTQAGPIIRPDFTETTLEQAFDRIASYEIGKSTVNLTCIQSHIRSAAGNSEELLNIEKMMKKVLDDPQATADSKRVLLKELSWMGSDYSVPSIKNLASDASLKDEAEYALERLGK
jgi:type 1 glutamine amidotransferase